MGFCSYKESNWNSFTGKWHYLIKRGDNIIYLYAKPFYIIRASFVFSPSIFQCLPLVIDELLLSLWCELSFKQRQRWQFATYNHHLVMEIWRYFSHLIIRRENFCVCYIMVHWVLVVKIVFLEDKKCRTITLISMLWIIKKRK